MPSRLVNTVQLYFEQHGTGPPLVYVHGGFATLGRRLQGAVKGRWHTDFSRQFSFVSYDRRGCGRSACPEDGYDPVTQAGDLDGIVEALRLDRVHLFASSAGAPIAVVFAAAHPDKVRSLTIQGSSPVIVRPRDGLRDPALAAHAAVQAEGPAAAFEVRPPGVEIWFESVWGRRQAEADDRLADYVREEKELIARAAALPRATRVMYYAAEVRNIAAYDGFEPRPYARAVRAPTLVLHGARDQVFTPAAGRELAAMIPGARFELIADAGHGPAFTSDIARKQAIEFMQCHT
jgi:pimeloyl-ACP methyl ester carboxylesterase